MRKGVPKVNWKMALDESEEILFNVTEEVLRKSGVTAQEVTPCQSEHPH